MASKNSYAETINSAKVMLAGLRLNTERVGKRGISADFITRFDALQESSKDLDDEQEDMKARLKMKTSQLDDNMKALDKMMAEAKKAVKLEMEQDSWKSFGIQDKR